MLEFLKLYGIELENRDKILSMKNIKAFLNSLKQDSISFKIEINSKEQNLTCNFREKKIVNLKKDDNIKIKDIEFNKLGYFLVPKSEKNYKELYNFNNYIDFKIKYFDIGKKRYKI